MILRRYIFPLFKSIYFVLFFLGTALSAAFWYFSPLMGNEDWRPFADVVPRVVVIWVIALLFLTAMLIIFLVRRKRDKDMEEDIAEPEIDPAEAMFSAEMDEMKGKFKLAMKQLRKSKGGRRALKDLPWYIIIGPPGAGKTTAIVNSGLQFPLAESMGKSAIGGVGGTRNCDWWFTNEAILIDTAGRYTTHESGAEADNKAWTGFLGLLKKYRPRQPINGAIVAISLSDLLMQDTVTQKSHAQAVRRRLAELRAQLGVRFPVYVLFTKADLIVGFSEFFDNLGKEDREQVWGFTLPLKGESKDKVPLDAFDAEFDALLAQLNAQMLERMQSEIDPQRRALVAGFPSQVAAMRSVAHTFLDEVFQENVYEARQMMRGVYFTSGTQEGTPIDRLMLSMAQTFGIGRQAIGTGQGSGRSYFLTRLFENVLFPEAGLVSADDKVERRFRWARRVAVTMTVLVALGMGGLWVRSYLGNVDMIDTASAQTGAYQAAAAALPQSPIGDTDLPPVVEALNMLRDLPGNPVLDEPPVERHLTYGLYRGEVIGTQAAQTYRAALNQRFLPRLLLRLEEQIAASINDPDRLYDTLKIYLMLGLQGPMNTDQVKEWLKSDWDVAYRGTTRAPLRADLSDHLDALLSQEMQEVALNGPLVEHAQDVLSAMPLAQRIYNGIIASDSAVQLPEWRLTTAGGPAVKRVFVRSSGRELNDGIEGIYTYDGFHDVFLPKAVSVAELAQSEAWVLGDQAETINDTNALLRLSRDVLALYYNDYVARYDTLLGDIDIIPMESKSHAVEVINVLSGPTSPIVFLLTEVANETRLTEDRSPVNTEAVSEGVDRFIGLEYRTLSPQSMLLLDILFDATESVDGEPIQPPGYYVEQRFEWLDQMVDRVQAQPSSLDDLMELLVAVYRKLSGVVINDSVEATEQIAAFQSAANRMEGPIPRWATQIATGSTGVAAEGTRASINAKWQANILPFCEQVMDGRYPFDKRSRTDVAMTDFTRLFGPSGMIDTFFQENLLKYVDTRTRPWSWKRMGDADLGISQAVLNQMQAAAEIKDAFFGGNPSPLIQFQILPFALDPKAKKAILEIDGQSIEFRPRKGQPPPTAVTWPGPVGFARVTLEPSKRGNENVLQRDGPWAWFRLLDAAEVRGTGASDRKLVNFIIGGRLVQYRMQSGSVLNPFALPALSKFSCPSSI